MAENRLIKFYKYNGAGNDFIIVDNRSGFMNVIKDKHGIIKQMCHRRFGIGADGFIEVITHNSLDFEMIYYNSDGKVGTLCGNGARCCVAFCKKMNIVKSNTTNFLACDGIHKAEIQEDNLVELEMKDIKLIKTYDTSNYFVDNGSNHYVKFVNCVDQFNLNDIGPRLRYDSRFDLIGGTNVNFVEVLNEDTLKVRTYERGIEAETLACGTGSVAAVVVYVIHHLKYETLDNKSKSQKNRIMIKCRGGDLFVTFTESLDGNLHNICLLGPAKFTFEGTVNLNVFE